MVTLRAMDSDILTQQTLGRGLRLPFGKYTEEEPIDTLDVVAHDSFRLLLDSEKVLRSFGVEKVLDPAPQPGTGTGAGTGSPPAPAPSPDPDPATTLRELGGDGTDPEKWHLTPTPRAVVELVERFRTVSFLFPRTTRVREDSYYSLSKLPNSEVERAAYRVTEMDTAVMERYKPNFKPHTITPERLRQQPVAGLEVDAETVRRELKTTLLRHRLIEPNNDNIGQIDNRILPEFLRAVPLHTWTMDTLAVAATLLSELVDREVAAFAKTLQPVVKLCPPVLRTRGGQNHRTPPWQRRKVRAVPVLHRLGEQPVQRRRIRL
ncbi:hypothetical protein CKJ85_03890 [Corynebacterium sp. NML 150383]|uniref:hypothetical protein n=1 Tax=Corynebacterium sp. NML 150383 TaxID=2029400 RepID=UPI000BD794A2|nr:hypothetical protein [Corynebacterium sp. NML 150383]PAT03954.1 hypothetical protein CKJ85_03890 [Corynebacterium sp. NML 150383]